MSKNKKEDIDLSALAGESGLTLLKDSEYAMVFDRLPTFFPNVDRVFGGGLPFGRMVEVAGKPGAGKCLTKDTNILTPEGYKTVEQIIYEQGLEASCVSKEVPAEIELINRYGDVEKTSHIQFNNRLDVYEVITRTGLKQRITANHPLLVAGRTGVQEWKKAIDLNTGDFLVTRRGDEVFGDTNLNEKQAYLLGALTADGYLGEKTIEFTNSNELILEKVRDSLDWLFGKHSDYGNDLRVHGVQEVKEFYTIFGVTSGIAKDKEVPKSVLSGTKETQLTFIRGYMDCESSINRNTIEVTSASEKLITQLQLMLKNLGIVSFVRTKRVESYPENTYKELSIRGQDFRDYLDIVGLVENKHGIENVDTSIVGNSNHDFVPFANELLTSYYRSSSEEVEGLVFSSLVREGRNVSRNNVERVLQTVKGDRDLKRVIEVASDTRYYYDEVISIEHTGKEPTFDFTLPKTHSFIAESIVNHNSHLAYHVARIGTELGCLVVLIDVEGTADRERLEHLGIDTSKVFVKQPDPDAGIKLTVEEVGSTIEKIIEVFSKQYPDRPIIFIWDSVGQTPSNVEMDKDFGEMNVGARAKAITQFVTKIAPMVSEHKSLLIGINQVRDHIGGNPMFPTYSVPGGNAWEHYASLRIEVKRKKAVKQGDMNIGHTMGINIRKSKVSRPFQEVDITLISDNGVDYEDNLCRLGMDAKVVKGVGQSYEFIDSNGEIHKKRRADFVEWLRTEEGANVRMEILQQLTLVEFPEMYPPLNNRSLEITDWVDAKNLASLYGIAPLAEPTKK